MPSHPELEPLWGKLGARHKIYKPTGGPGEPVAYEAVFIDPPSALNFHARAALIRRRHLPYPLRLRRFLPPDPVCLDGDGQRDP